MKGNKRRIIELCVLIFIFMIGTLAVAAEKQKEQKKQNHQKLQKHQKKQK